MDTVAVTICASLTEPSSGLMEECDSAGDPAVDEPVVVLGGKFMAMLGVVGVVGTSGSRPTNGREGRR